MIQEDLIESISKYFSVSDNEKIHPVQKIVGNWLSATKYSQFDKHKLFLINDTTTPPLLNSNSFSNFPHL